jgi:hypothetical protein
MAETIVENQICNACGADVRKGALFCYNCGGAVASEIIVVKNDKNKRISKTRSRKKLSQENENGIEIKVSKVAEKPVIRETLVEEPIANPIAKPNPPAEEIELKSAATIRKSKIVQPKKVEVIWEEHEDTPNIWFIIVTVVLTVLAAVILFLALRMR